MKKEAIEGIIASETQAVARENSETASELRCNCDDEFATEVCPVCAGGSSIPGDNRGLMVITDADLVPEEIRQWPPGYAFVCKECNHPAILDYMKHCGECGAKAVIQSHKATAFIRKLQEKKTNGTGKYENRS